jgi:hypothetical protein
LGQFSLVYRHIFIYRFVMNILYLGKYNRRFDQILIGLNDLPSEATVLELCFGDVYIAEHCKKMGLAWRGIDINQKFVKFAKRHGYDAHWEDLITVHSLPSADVCIMAGSLYHFHPDHTFAVLKKMLDSANKIIISEPIENLSSRKGFLGYIAKRAASVGSRQENFRFTSFTLLTLLKGYSESLHFDITSIRSVGKDSIVILNKHGSH